MPKEPARRGLGEPALKKNRGRAQGLGPGGEGRAGKEAKPALSPVPRQKGQGQKRIGPPSGEAKGPGAEGEGAPEHGLRCCWAIMHAGERIAEENHHRSAPKGPQERSALPGPLEHGQREAQGPGRGFEGGSLLGLAPGPEDRDWPVAPEGGPEAEEQTQIVGFVEHPKDDALAFSGQGRTEACALRGA